MIYISIIMLIMSSYLFINEKREGKARWAVLAACSCALFYDKSNNLKELVRSDTFLVFLLLISLLTIIYLVFLHFREDLQ
jgi:hypothetical protein